MSWSIYKYFSPSKAAKPQQDGSISTAAAAAAPAAARPAAEADLFLATQAEPQPGPCWKRLAEEQSASLVAHTEALVSQGVEAMLVHTAAAHKGS